MVLALLVTSLSHLSAGKAAAGFLNYPGQTFANPSPSQYPFSSYLDIHPYVYSHPLPVRNYQVPTPFPETGCIHYLGFTVPCHVGGSSVLTEDPAASLAPPVDSVSNIVEDITADTKSDVDASPKINEVRSL